MGLGDLAAKMAKRIAIMKQVGELRDKIRDVRIVKTELKNSDTAISNTLMQWTSRYNAFQSSPMSEVVVTDKFEGVSAEKIKTRLPEAIQAMDQTQASTENVRGEISIQITKIDEYIEKLEEEIAALLSSLAAL